MRITYWPLYLFIVFSICNVITYSIVCSFANKIHLHRRHCGHHQSHCCHRHHHNGRRRRRRHRRLHHRRCHYHRCHHRLGHNHGPHGCYAFVITAAIITIVMFTWWWENHLQWCGHECISISKSYVENIYRHAFENECLNSEQADTCS